ncbi:hypothetical protein VTK56DRAFT_7306 [Thermocarpiscus australiensis]
MPCSESTTAGGRLASDYTPRQNRQHPEKEDREDQQHIRPQGPPDQTDRPNGYRPQRRPRLTTTVPATRSNSAGRHHVATPASAYMSLVHTLDPRSLDELHNERSYLLYDLQKQGDRATRLFQKYAALEARLSNAQTATEAKKCTRAAARVRAKIAESMRQEQLILLRLGEIHVELQNRARWTRVLHQQPPQQQQRLPAMGYRSWAEMSPCQDTPSTVQSWDYFSCRSALSPLSPCFTPGVAFAQDMWSRTSKSESAAERETEDNFQQPESDQVGEASQTCQDMDRSEGGEQSPEDGVDVDQPACDSDQNSEDEDVQFLTARLRRFSLHFPLSLKARDRRLSLPQSETLWPRSRRNSVQSSVV